MNRLRTTVGTLVLIPVVPLAVIAMVSRKEWGNAPIAALLLLGAVGGALVAAGQPTPTGEAPSTRRLLGSATLGAGGVAVTALVLIGAVLLIILLFQTMFSGIVDAIGDSISGGS